MGLDCRGRGPVFGVQACSMFWVLAPNLSTDLHHKSPFTVKWHKKGSKHSKEGSDVLFGVRQGALK